MKWKKTSSSEIYYTFDTGIAQSVKRPTEKPKSNSDMGSSPGAASFFLPESIFNADSLTTSPFAVACINIGSHVKNPKRW